MPLSLFLLGAYRVTHVQVAEWCESQINNLPSAANGPQDPFQRLLRDALRGECADSLLKDRRVALKSSGASRPSHFGAFFRAHKSRFPSHLRRELLTIASSGSPMHAFKDSTVTRPCSLRCAHPYASVVIGAPLQGRIEAA